MRRHRIAAMKRLLAAAALLTGFATSAYEVDESKWFGYFAGKHAQHPALLLLSTAKCTARGGRPQDKWFVALEVVRLPLIDRTVEEVEVPACWRRDPDGSKNRQYCRVDRASNELGDVCLWIGDEHFLNTRTLPRQAPSR